MRHLIVSFTLAIGLILPGKSILALTPRQVYLTQLSRLKLYVWPGQGLTLNFLPAHLIVRFVSLGHPGQFTLSSDGSLCPLPTEEAKKTCSNTGANVLFTRLIGPHPLEFPGLQASADGSTQLSLIVQSPNGEKQAVPVELVPGKGQPEYGEIDVLPDSQKPTPLLAPSTAKPAPEPIPLPPRVIQQSTRTGTPRALVPPTSPKKVQQAHPQLPSQLSANPAPSQSGSRANPDQIAIEKVSNSINDANAAAFGLSEAKREGQINPGTTVWNAVQTAITWLRRGYSREAAAQRAGLQMPILNQLIAWGQNRP